MHRRFMRDNCPGREGQEEIVQRVDISLGLMSDRHMDERKRRVWQSLQSLSDEEYDKLPPIDADAFEAALQEGREARDAVIRETPAVWISSRIRFR